MYSNSINVQHGVDVVQWLSLVWLCSPMNCSISGFPVLHYLLEFVQTHVHWVSDAISSSIIPFSFCQWAGSLHWCNQSIDASASAPILPVNIQGWFPLGLTSLISFLFKGPSKVFSNTTVWKQFFSTQPSLYSNCHIYTWLLEKW